MWAEHRFQVFGIVYLLAEPVQFSDNIEVIRNSNQILI
jgi:hypothetical protein